MSHANALLTPAGRFIMIQRIQSGRAVAHVAAEMGVSRTTAWRWWRRFREAGVAGLQDRSSVAHTHPHRTAPCQEARVRIMRELTRRGPVFIGARLGMHASVVGRVLRRYQVPLLRNLDPVTGTVIRASRNSANRYEHAYPGSLLHVDVKKLGRVPDGGGWRVHGRSEQVRGRGIGYDYVHAAIDDHSRVAYAEVHDDEKGVTAAGFLQRAVEFYAALGVTVERVISDNAFAYRKSVAFRTVIEAHGITQKFIRPHCPWTNGKVERLNRTLATEWAYARPFILNTERRTALQVWLDYYNLDRAHLGIGGKTPIDRINNGRGQYTGVGVDARNGERMHDWASTTSIVDTCAGMFVDEIDGDHKHLLFGPKVAWLVSPGHARRLLAEGWDGAEVQPDLTGRPAGMRILRLDSMRRVKLTVDDAVTITPGWGSDYR